MGIRNVLTASCTVLLLVYATAVPATTGVVVGQVNPHGTVLLNGTVMPSQTTIFSGDKVVSQENASAAFTFAGGDQILLGSGSTAVAAHSTNRVIVQLEGGALAVVSKSDQPLMIAAGGAHIGPKGTAPAIYEVSLHGSSLLVTARSGNATVETANKTVEVKEGSAFEATMNPPAPQATGNSLTSLQTGALVVATAAGIAGLALGAAALSNQPPNPRDCSVSPSSFQITCP
jgi:ferric-dicitrate binding protein FerR (iron transport regulator)